MTATSIDKALEICEALSRAPRGASVGELARTLGLPAPTVHRLLAVLKRRGYVRQDEETQRYGLTLKMLDLSCPVPGPLRAAAARVPVLREYVLGSGCGRSSRFRPPTRSPTCGPRGTDEVADADGVRQGDAGATARCTSRDAGDAASGCLRLDGRAMSLEGARCCGAGPHAVDGAAPPLGCTCAPVVDYTGREVARLGIFGSRRDETPLVHTMNRDGWELARQVSRRLGWLPPTSMGHPRLRQSCHGGVSERSDMAYIITEPCIGTKDSACVRRVSGGLHPPAQ
jgi:DNA-binding transcriptional ArsR family regulator